MLTGKTHEEKIWNYMRAAGMNACGAAGLMGNLRVESGLISINLQNSGEKKLGYTDASYTEAVDSGTYAGFARDGAGYGLAQWTHPARKAALLAFAREAGTSVGDLETQLAFLVHEMEKSFPAVLSALKTAKTVEEASNAVLLNYERPANRGEAVRQSRARYGQAYYDQYAKPAASPAVMTPAEKALRKKVVDIINGWVGAAKGSAKHLEILAVYNGHKPLARGYQVRKNDAYCAATVSAAYIRAGIAEYTGTECGVGKFIDLAKSKGIWVENDAHVPGLGDACVYDWQDDGAGDCLGAGDHIGIVSDVSGDTFTVTEGNMSGGKVGKRTMRVNGRYIRGFICPDFAAIAKEVANTPMEAIDKLAKLGVINSPDYWKEAVRSGKVWCLDLLLVKAARKITKVGPRSGTPENGIGALVAAGVIDTPDYWLEHYRDYPSLGALLCALGGAVK